MITLHRILAIFILMNGISFSTDAQEISFDTSFVTLENIFQQIEGQAEIKLVYSEDQINTKATIQLTQPIYQFEELIELIQLEFQLEFKQIADYYAIAPSTKSANKNFQTIRGLIKDDQTGKPLAFANVYQIDQLSNATTTDINGAFEISVPIGRVKIAISYVGFKTLIIPLLVNIAQEEYLTLNMEASTLILKEVTIEAERANRMRNELAYASGRSFSVQEANRYAGTLGDPARMVRAYAGVIPARDDRNDIVIRGNSPTGIQWKLDNIEIPNPNHYGGIGLTGNTTTLLNINLLENSDFLMGAFPSEYGNVLSGVFDLHTRAINPNRRQHRFQTGWNGLEFGTEGPFVLNKPNTYSLTYRYSLLEAMDGLGINYGILPKYQDFTGKFDFKLGDNTELSLLGIWGVSSIKLDDRDLESEDTTGTGESITTGSDLALVGINLNHRFNEKWSLTTNFSVIDNQIKTQIDTFNYISDAEKRIFTDKSREVKYAGLIQLDRRTNRNTLRGGIRWDTYSVNYNRSSSFDSDTNRIVHNKSDYLNFARLFLENEYRISERLRARAGIHSQFLFLNNSFALEPRLGLSYSISEINRLSFSYGNHHMLQPRNIYFVETHSMQGSDLTNMDLDFSASHHLTISYNHHLTESLVLSTEAYYQYLYNIPVEQDPTSTFSMVNVGADFFIPQVDSLVNEGSGKNYGIELTLEQYLKKGYYFMINTSLFQSKYRTLENKWRSTAFDMQYSFNVLAGYEKWMTQKVAFGADLRLSYAGGRPYIPVDEPTSVTKNEVVFNEIEAFQPRYPAYFRTDLKIYYRINYNKIYTEFAIDLQNITNSQNIYQREFDPKRNEYKTFYHTSFFPMFTFRCLF